MLIPTVIDNNSALDIFSKLLEERIVLITSTIETQMASNICAQLMYLDAKNSDIPITIYINSPGGSVTAALAIYDTMKLIKSHVKTVCIGLAASAGALLLCAGKERFITPNAEVLIHQPLLSGQGLSGQVTDLKIHTDHLIKVKQNLTNIMAEHCKKTYEEMIQYLERDYIMNAREAVNFGLADKILEKNE